MFIIPAFRRTEDRSEAGDSLSYTVNWRLAWAKANLSQKVTKNNLGYI